MAASKKPRLIIKAVSLVPAIVGTITSIAELPKKVAELPKNIPLAWFVTKTIVVKFGLIAVNTLISLILLVALTAALLAITGQWKNLEKEPSRSVRFTVIPYLLALPTGILFTFVRPPAFLKGMFMTVDTAAIPILYVLGFSLLAVTLVWLAQLWQVFAANET